MEFEDDYDHVVAGLVYSPSNIPGPKTRLDEFADLENGCECTTDCVAYCSHLAEFGLHYENGLLLRSDLRQPVFECNTSCRCEPARCMNRVVQRGPRKDLEIVHVEPKGLGVVCKSPLRVGDFVCEYAGEIIDEETAKHRFSEQSRTQAANYILVVREYGGDKLVYRTIVDPTVIGNIGRYLNHSCSGNLCMVPVRVDTSQPHLALFASRHINQGEELCFNYGDPGNMKLAVKEDRAIVREDRIICHCGASNCAGYLPFDNDLLIT